MSTTTVGIHVATVRQYDSNTGVATVVIPALYGDTAIEARPFLSSPAEALNLPALDPGDTVIAFYDGGDSTTILRWYLTAGHGVGGVGGDVSAEDVMDIVASFLREGTGIDLVYDDAGNVLTISSTASGPTLPIGGTRMQVVSKNSTAPGDATWRDPTWLVASSSQPGASDYGLTTIPYGAIWIVMP